MAEHNTPLQVYPGKGLGFLSRQHSSSPRLSCATNSLSSVLGASLHDVLTRLKSQPLKYPTIDVSYSPSKPLLSPVGLTLPQNGIRLRFDGPDQRLRLIEVLDFTKTPLSYKNIDVTKLPENAPLGRTSHEPTGPAFRHIYHRLIGPTFPGEYITPPAGEGTSEGTYILSYPGIAFSFPLQATAWSPKIDFVSLLSSSAASPARSLAIFNGPSWQEARQSLFTRIPLNPRSLALSGRGREGIPDEIELVKVFGKGRIEMTRRSSLPFRIVLSQTTPQDLVAELGPPDAIYRKNDRRLSIHKTGSRGSRQQHRSQGVSPGRYDDLTDGDQSSANTTTDDSDGEDNLTKPNQNDSDLSAECFYNYFHHGFDVFISYPTDQSPPFPGADPSGSDPTQAQSSNRLVATKILLHGNVPGSYPFNRYRRSRWIIDPKHSPSSNSPLTSETSFSELSKSLRHIWKDTYASEAEETSSQRGMVLNRGWGDSPGSSCELLGGWEESADGVKDTNNRNPGSSAGPGFGNTELFGFPGLVFEVLENDAVSCLTVF